MSYQRDAPERLRIGMVGVGSHAYRNVLPVLTFLPVELVAVADPDARLADATARQYGARSFPSAAEMYAACELDAVLICVSPTWHPSLAVEAFGAGLHVWVEKPAAVTVADVDRMLASRDDRIAVVGYKKAFMPAAEKARELIEDGLIGDLLTLLAVYPMTIPRGDRAWLDTREPTNWLLNGCHPTSLLLSLGGPVDTVATHRGPRDAGALILRHTSGVVSTLHLASGAPQSQPFELYAAYGTRGSVRIDDGRRVVLQRGIEFDYTRTTTFAPPGIDSGAIVWEAQNALNTLENKALFTQGLYAELRHFVDAVLGGTQPELGTLEFAREIAAVYEAAVLSDGDAVAVTGKGN